MSVTIEKAEEIIAAWRAGEEPGDGWDSPAGPLLPSGEYAESEITMTGPPISGRCGTACTASPTRYCC
ncbi:MULTISPECIES: DUF6229 family protein [Streptosporangium]|uniref:Mersacidin/lichenicidin family type 2 lantibiotic n=1 Tax=Streptosporangium brasiliense TaxID=47480 RepID=A0ABT9R5G5_9ACTN|nr:DUF6229 family protein [Streptosporangium brasiliense]MDP9864480.1 hypothetical protein [Streptosporangium brasiliense]